MINGVKNTITRCKTHVRPEDEETTKGERNDEKDRFESFIEFRSRQRKNYPAGKQNQYVVV
jgi:hypothetical protein